MGNLACWNIFSWGRGEEGHRALEVRDTTEWQVCFRFLSQHSPTENEGASMFVETSNLASSFTNLWSFQTVNTLAKPSEGREG